MGSRWISSCGFGLLGCVVGCCMFLYLRFAVGGCIVCDLRLGGFLGVSFR